MPDFSSNELTRDKIIPVKYHDNGDGTFSEVVYNAGGGGGGSNTTPTGVTLIPPKLANFAALNQGSIAPVENSSGIILSCNISGGINISGLIVDAPAPPYTATTYIAHGMQQINYAKNGFIWYSSVSGQVIDFAILWDNAFKYTFTKFNSINSFNAHYAQRGASMDGADPPKWMRIGDDGTNRYCQLSSDGYTWITIFSAGRTDFMTPNKIGIFTDSESGYLTKATFLHWALG